MDHRRSRARRPARLAWHLDPAGTVRGREAVSRGLGVIVLAAGHGRRLGNRWPGLPKPMLPVGGVPIVARVLARVQELGVEQVTVIWGPPAQEPGVSRDGQLLEEYLRTTFGSSLVLVPGAGTGSADDGYRGFAATGTDDCLILPSDLAFDLDLTALVERHRSGESGATVVVTTSPLCRTSVGYGLDATGGVVARRNGDQVAWGDPGLAQEWATPTGIGIVRREEIPVAPPTAGIGLGEHLYDRIGARGALTALHNGSRPMVDIGSRTFLAGLEPGTVADIGPRLAQLLVPEIWWGKPRRTHRAQHQQKGEAMSTIIRDTVAREWCLLLEVDEVRDGDNFFEAGGDSLTAVELVERLETVLQRKIPVDALFIEGTFGAVLASCEGVR
ncbi:NTP transferase domain-containing protein [Kribbella sp. NPDC051718]|uniref:NTP transferase domain-containing protein n=1 Tax=Kribbella sp. NPDC051718 TaxID=3155168 RepID=UPI003422C655